MSTKIKESMLPPLWVMVLGLSVFSVWLISELREIVALIIVSYAVAYLIEPILKKLESLKIRRQVGIITVAGVAAIILCVLFFTVLPVLQREFLQLIGNLPDYIDRAHERLDPLIEKFQSMLGKEVDGTDTQTILNAAKGLVPKILEGLQTTLLQGYSITLAIINLALLPFMIFYISMSFSDYRPLFLRLFSAEFKPKVNGILNEIDTFVSSFVRGQLIVSFVLFILYAIGLGIVGVELWFLLAVIAGFGNLVPYLGTITGILLSSIMALITFGDFQHLLYVWAVFGIVQFLEGSFITPKILGDNVGLSPLAIILAIFVGGKLFGLLGIFLAVPGAAILKVLTIHFHAWLLTKTSVK